MSLLLATTAGQKGPVCNILLRYEDIGKCYEKGDQNRGQNPNLISCT